jgi:hypothetical protein
MTGSYNYSNGEVGTYVGNKDDGWFRIEFPPGMTIIWGGVTYTNVWVSTNSYVLFNNYMSPTVESAGPFSASNWSYPNNSKIFISAADNSCQRLFTRYYTENNLNKYTIRYEGCNWNGTNTPAGQSNIIWELTFVDSVDYYNKIVLDVILNGRLTNDQASYSALCGASTQLQAFVPSTATSWLLELGANQSTWAIASLLYSRKKKLVVSGSLGVMLIGDEDIPLGDPATVGYMGGGAFTDPETYRNQIYFHSNLPYIKMAEFVTIPTITYPALEPDLRTWADPGSGGCGGGC